MKDWTGEILVTNNADGMYAQIRVSAETEDGALLGCRYLCDRIIHGRNHVWRAKPEVQKYSNFEEPPRTIPQWQAYARFSVVVGMLGDDP